MSDMSSRKLDVASRLIDAYDSRRTIAPITASDPSFDLGAAWAVLHEIHARRIAAGWRAAGRKIGFTNRTIWPRYGVDRPMWSHVWTHTVANAVDGRGVFTASDFVQPRLEPEVVFGLRGPVSTTGDARAVLDAVDWIAPGFEVVQSHFPDWKFAIADCTAAFGLHAALIVGARVRLDDRKRDELAELLPRFEVTLYRGDEVADRGRGTNVLDSPALALQHLARVVESQPEAAPLHAGEIITTGTLTDAQPMTAGTRWRPDYGELGIEGLEVVVK